MRGARGYAVITSPGATKETDTFTCSHCQRVVFVDLKKDKKSLGGFCLKCMKNICSRPACHNNGCTPFIEKIRRREQDQYRRDQNAIAMG